MFFYIIFPELEHGEKKDKLAQSYQQQSVRLGGRGVEAVGWPRPGALFDQINFQNPVAGVQAAAGFDGDHGDDAGDFT